MGRIGDILDQALAPTPSGLLDFRFFLSTRDAREEVLSADDLRLAALLVEKTLAFSTPGGDRGDGSAPSRVALVPAGDDLDTHFELSYLVTREDKEEVTEENAEEWVRRKCDLPVGIALVHDVLAWRQFMQEQETGNGVSYQAAELFTGRSRRRIRADVNRKGGIRKKRTRRTHARLYAKDVIRWHLKDWKRLPVKPKEREKTVLWRLLFLDAETGRCLPRLPAPNSEGRCAHLEMDLPVVALPVPCSLSKALDRLTTPEIRLLQGRLLAHLHRQVLTTDEKAIFKARMEVLHTLWISRLKGIVDDEWQNNEAEPVCTCGSARWYCAAAAGTAVPKKVPKAAGLNLEELETLRCSDCDHAVCIPAGTMAEAEQDAQTVARRLGLEAAKSERYARLWCRRKATYFLHDTTRHVFTSSMTPEELAGRRRNKADENIGVEAVMPPFFRCPECEHVGFRWGASGRTLGNPEGTGTVRTGHGTLEARCRHCDRNILFGMNDADILTALIQAVSRHGVTSEHVKKLLKEEDLPGELPAARRAFEEAFEAVRECPHCSAREWEWQGSFTPEYKVLPKDADLSRRTGLREDAISYGSYVEIICTHCGYARLLVYDEFSAACYDSLRILESYGAGTKQARQFFAAETPGDTITPASGAFLGIPYSKVGPCLGMAPSNLGALFRNALERHGRERFQDIAELILELKFCIQDFGEPMRFAFPQALTECVNRYIELRPQRVPDSDFVPASRRRW